MAAIRACADWFFARCGLLMTGIDLCLGRDEIQR
jgi:hypothetical protein